MNTIEMQMLFETMLQTSSPAYDSSEKPDTDTIFRYLNTAQTEYIKQVYLSLPTFAERTKFLGGNILDLNLLVTESSLQTEVSATPYPYSVYLSDKTDQYWHVISIVTEISRSKPDTLSLTPVQLFPVNIGDIDRYLTTINNIPIILVPVYTQITPYNDTVIQFLVTYDKYTGFNTADAAIKMIYLKKPKLLVLDMSNPAAYETTQCELAEYLHNNIVKLGVQLFEQDKYKLASIDNSTKARKAKDVIANLGE